MIPKSGPFGPPRYAVSQSHRLAELLPGEAFVFVEGMAVDVQGGTGLRMAQQTCHCAHIHTLGDEHTSICVPQAILLTPITKPVTLVTAVTAYSL